MLLNKAGNNFFLSVFFHYNCNYLLTLKHIAMKTSKLLLIVSLFCISICAKSQITESGFDNFTTFSSKQTERILDIVVHDVSLPEFVYDKTLPLQGDEFVEFNLPMAQDFSITGGKHVHFRMEKENFDSYFYENHIKDGYFDLILNIKNIYGGGTNTAIGIIRIVFK